MANSQDNRLQFDKRVVERNIRKGVVTRDAFDKHLKTLPDVEDQSELIAARLEDDVDDES